MSSQRVEAYAVTGATERVYPAAGASPDYTEWGYYGFTLANISQGTPYRVTFTDGRGHILDTLSLEPGETRSEWYGPQGLRAASQIQATFVPDSATGLVVGSIRVG